jgi:hypothetical protein
MEEEIPVEAPKTYPDPTKPLIKEIHDKPGLGWIIFIGFNIAIPIIFLAIFLKIR